MRFAALILLVLLPCTAHAGWRDLKKGDSPARVNAMLGAPLLTSKSRGIEIWIYDRTGAVEFNDGRVVYWQPSLRDPAAAKSVAKTS